MVTADLSLEYFQVLRRNLDELSLGRGCYGFVVGHKGTVVSHPDPRYRIPDRTAALADVHAGDLFSVFGEDTALARLVLDGEAGSGRATDFATGKPATFLFAPIDSAHWSFVAVIPDEADPE